MKRLLVALALCGALPLARPALGDEAPAAAARCTLRVVHALPQEGGFDPRLEALRRRLSRPQFMAWRTFHLLSTQEQEIQPGASVEYSLPDGRKARLTYAEHAEGPNGKHLVRGSLELEGARSNSRTMFALDEGGVLLVAGARHLNGILIYALSCRTEK
jgi:hypothetical protein